MRASGRSGSLLPRDQTSTERDGADVLSVWASQIVVTIDHRLGALGFLSQCARAARRAVLQVRGTPDEPLRSEYLAAVPVAP